MSKQQSDASGSTATAGRLFPGTTELARLCRSRDWSATPLGPIDSWPQSLQTIASTVVASPFGMMVAWGPHLVQIYNDRYRELMGDKHPAGLGQSVRECWPEIWPDISPLFGRALSGESLLMEDMKLVMNRRGYMEDAFFTFSYSPVLDERGKSRAFWMSSWRRRRALRGSDSRRNGMSCSIDWKSSVRASLTCSSSHPAFWR